MSKQGHPLWKGGRKAQSGHYCLDTTYQRFSFSGADEITIDAGFLKSAAS
jgi:hypothetical protein